MAMTFDELWKDVSSSFVDDGESGLPTVELSGLSALEIGDTYLRIRSQSRLIRTESSFWHNTLEKDLRLDDVTNAAELVTSDQATPFAFAADSVEFDGTTIPTLVVEIFPNSVDISYSVKDSWDARSVFAFFGWLSSLIDETKDGQLVPSSVDGPVDAPQFKEAWSRFRSSRKE